MLDINQQIDDEIIGFLKNNPGNTFSKEIAKDIGYDAEVVAKRLFELNKRGHVLKSKAEKGKNVYEINTDVKKQSEPQQISSHNFVSTTATGRKKILPSDEDKNNTTEKSLNELEQQLKMPRRIENKQHKIKVLSRLADLLDDSISEVLISITKDLNEA